jgi:hypothetical protein
VRRHREHSMISFQEAVRAAGAEVVCVLQWPVPLKGRVPSSAVKWLLAEMLQVLLKLSKV